jgi:hypothetical protein
VNIQRRIYGHDTGVVIHPLNPEKAVQAASDLLGEFIIFAVLFPFKTSHHFPPEQSQYSYPLIQLEFS